MATEIEDSDLGDKDSVIPPLVYLEDYKNEKSLSNSPSVEPTPETRTPSKIYTNKTT